MRYALVDAPIATGAEPSPSVLEFKRPEVPGSLSLTCCAASDLLEESGAAGRAGEGAFWQPFNAASKLVLDKRFALEEPLARGGMSWVFQAKDLKLSQVVAIKIVPPSLSEVVSRSLDLTRALEHPSILRVEHVGKVAGGGLFLVMPLLEGITFHELLAGVNPGPEALLLAFRKGCEAIAYAHARGIVHRDLKPSNLHLDPLGRTVVLDWDLARPDGPLPASEPGILGTPLYMAPEQLDSRSVGAQTDVHALGTILYEIIAGIHPVSSGKAWDLDLPKVAYRIRNEMPPPPSYLAKGPARSLKKLDGIVLRCLAKEPQARFASAGALLEELEGA